MDDYSFFTEDQRRVFNNIKEQYSNKEQYGELYKEIDVKQIEGSDKVVVTFTNWRRNGLEIYLPAEIDDNTSSYTYYSPGGLADRGAGGGFVLDNAITSALNENNNAIFCITSGDDKENFGLDGIETMLGENGLNSNTCMGWSLGGYTAYESTLNKIKENPDIEAQTMVLLDVQYNGSSLVTSEENLEYFKKNGTVIMSFESIEVGPEQFRNCQNYKDIAAAGIPLVIVEMPGDHPGAPRNAFEGDLIGFLNGEIDTIPSALGFYTFDENGNYIELDPEVAIETMRKNMNSSKFFSSSLEDVNKMIDEYKRRISLYSSSIRNKLSSIKSMMNEFLSTDAGFIGEQINEIINICNNSEISSMSVSNSYSSTTVSPKIQDEKILEYKANVLSLIESTLSYLDNAMSAHLEIEKTDHDISNEAASLSNNSEDILASTYIGLEAAAEAKGLTGNEKEEYVDKNMQTFYKESFYDEALNEAESKGLDGKEKEDYIEKYINNKSKEFKENMENYSYEVETTKTNSTEKEKSNTSSNITSNSNSNYSSEYNMTKDNTNQFP